MEMTKRSIVRLIMHKNTPTLIVERLYSKSENIDPQKYKNTDANPAFISNIFVNYVKSKTSLPVINKHRDVYYVNDCYIPRYGLLFSMPDEKLSYVDSGIPYKFVTEINDLIKLKTIMDE